MGSNLGRTLAACGEGKSLCVRPVYGLWCAHSFNGNVAVYKVLNLEMLLYKVRWHVSTVKECNLIARS